MISEQTNSKELDETTKEMKKLKEEAKPKNVSSKKKKLKKKSIDKSSLLFKNDINILKPKYYGKTKTLLFIGQTPVFILGESSKKYYNNINIII